MNVLKKIEKARLRPIRVFVFHSASDVYNPLLWWQCDWTRTEQFKQNILKLKSRYTFISLPEAWKHLTEDKFRLKNYVVLTADDGYLSLLNVLPWLEEQQIPITLFVNTKDPDKKSWSATNEEQARRTKPNVDMLEEVCPDLYLSKEELFRLDSPYITIGMHGHEHLDALKQSAEEFRANVEKCEEELVSHPRYVPFYAYTWGHHNVLTDNILKGMGLVPVLVRRNKNYDDAGYIDRICIDGIVL